GSSTDACTLLAPSVAAGGNGGSIIGWWKLNGNAQDSSGNDYHGTVNGATPTTGQDGSSNSAYSFDGVDDYVNVGKPSLIGGLTNEYSVSAWISISSQSGHGRIISSARTNSANGFGFGLNGINLLFTTYGVKDYALTTEGIVDETWYFLVAV